jgi:hypothetical protein
MTRAAPARGRRPGSSPNSADPAAIRASASAKNPRIISGADADSREARALIASLREL